QVLVTALRELYGIDPPVIEVGSLGGARELALNGYGIAMLPVETLRSPEEGSGLEVIAGLPRALLAVHALWAGRDSAMSAVAVVCDVAARIGREQAVQMA
ncbi:LysR family transcriptional regulator, partial [Streptomyces sp. NPDC059956]